MKSIMLKFQKTRKISLGIMVLLISGDLIKAGNQNNYGFNPIIAAQRFGSQVYENLSKAQFATAEDIEREREREAGSTADDFAENQVPANRNSFNSSQPAPYSKPNDNMFINKVNDDMAKSQFSKSKMSDSDIDQAEYGDETRLLEALGENPEDYQELIGGVVYSQWQKLGHNARKVLTGTWAWNDLAVKSGSQITLEKARRANGVVKFYKEKFKNKAYDVLGKDIKAFQGKIADSTNKALQKQLEFLLSSAKDAASILGKETSASRLKEVYKDFRPSVTGESIEESLAQAESSMRIAQADQDRDAFDLYNEVAKKLQSVKMEFDNIKRRSGDVLAESLKIANALLTAATKAAAMNNKETSKVELYQDIIAALIKEKKAEEVVNKSMATINTRVEKLIADSSEAPDIALEEAERQLVTLKADLHKLHNTPGGKNQQKIKEKNEEIKREEEVIRQLKEKVRQMEADDRIIAKRVDDLLSKHDGDTAAALEEIQDKIKLMRSGANKIDKGIKEVLDKKIKDEQKVVEKYDNMKDKVDAEVKKLFKIATDNPSDIIKQMNEENGALKDAEDALAKGKLKRFAPSQMKPLLEKVDLYKSVEKELKSELKKFNDKVSKKVNLLLLKNNQNDKAALQSLLSTVKSGGGYWNAIVGESDDVRIAKLEDPIDKEVVKRLQLKIKENVVSDPLALAISKLNTATSPVEIMTGMYAVIDASLAKAGSPVRMGTLSPEKRVELARALGVHQKSLLAIGQDKSSAVIKHDKKKAVIAKLLEDSSRILAQDVIGVSYEALQTGNAQVIGLDLALNTLVNKLTGGSQVSASANDVSYVDPQAEAYETLGLSPDASQAEIRSAYLNLAKVNHPDMGGDTAMFQRINEAYELLSNN